MKTFEKILKILSKNIVATIIFIVAIVFFVAFSDGVLSGLISAFGAVVACFCGVILYNEIKKGLKAEPVKPAETAKKEEQKNVKEAVKKAPAKKTAVKKAVKKSTKKSSKK